MNDELKMKVHEIVEHSTQALMRNDKEDKHWKVLLSLLRYRAGEFITMFEEFENGEEE